MATASATTGSDGRSNNSHAPGRSPMLHRQAVRQLLVGVVPRGAGLVHPVAKLREPRIDRVAVYIPVVDEVVHGLPHVVLAPDLLAVLRVLVRVVELLVDRLE